MYSLVHNPKLKVESDLDECSSLPLAIGYIHGQYIQCGTCKIAKVVYKFNMHGL